MGQPSPVCKTFINVIVYHVIFEGESTNPPIPIVWRRVDVAGQSQSSCARLILVVLHEPHDMSMFFRSVGPDRSGLIRKSDQRPDRTSFDPRPTYRTNIAFFEGGCRVTSFNSPGLWLQALSNRWANLSCKSPALFAASSLVWAREASKMMTIFLSIVYLLLDRKNMETQ